jgi:hypothetical protein
VAGCSTEAGVGVGPMTAVGNGSGVEGCGVGVAAWALLIVKYVTNC